MRRAKAAGMIAALLMLTSCSSFGLPGGVDSLLRPPALNQQQSEIREALSATLDTQDMTLKYPRGGEYRSAFIFHDMDDDGEEEAFVFYSLQSDPSVRLKVLKRENGSWRAVYDVGGEGTDVDFVEFARMEGGSNHLIAGWYDGDAGESTLSVYAVSGQRLTLEFSHNYALHLLGRFTGRESDDLLLIEPGASAVPPKLHLVRYASGELSITSSLELASDVRRFLNLDFGALYPDANAIFIDEFLDHSETATEIAQIQNGRLVSIVGKDSGPLFSMTFRSGELLSRDVNGDGVVEIPHQSLLAGYEAKEERAPLYLTSYMRYQNGEFSVLSQAVINHAAGYQVFFPDPWVDTVTVVSQSQYNEWRFYTLDSNEELLTELLRIRVYSKKDVQDKFTENYKLLGEKNLFSYYYYIPETSGEPLAITDYQFQRMFAFYENGG